VGRFQGEDLITEMTDLHLFNKKDEMGFSENKKLLLGRGGERGKQETPILKGGFQPGVVLPWLGGGESTGRSGERKKARKGEVSRKRGNVF